MKTGAAFFLIFFLVSVCSVAQTTSPRVLEAKRTSGSLKIDGLLNERAWKDAAVMSDLVEFRPKVGAIEDPANKTVSYLMYNDEGIYFGGFCHERTKDSISIPIMIS